MNGMTPKQKGAIVESSASTSQVNHKTINAEHIMGVDPQSSGFQLYPQISNKA